MTDAEITLDVSHLTRAQPALRIDNKRGLVDPRVREFAGSRFLGMAAPNNGAGIGDSLPLADFPKGANIAVRKRGGSVAFYKVIGRTIGSLLVSEVA